MRTDIHAPSNIQPEDYELAGWMISSKSEEHADVLSEAILEIEHLLGSEGVFLTRVPEPRFHGNHYNKGRCDHCGAAFVYKAVFQHMPTGDHIVVGLQCAQKTFPLSNLNRVHRSLTRANKRARTQMENKVNAQQWLMCNPSFAWISEDDAHYIAKSMWSQIKKGRAELSKKQLHLLKKIAIESEPTTELGCDKGSPWLGRIVEEGKRQQVSGVIVGEKEIEGYTGGTDTKWMVKAGEIKVWVTAPSILLFRGAKRGDGVQFSASVEFKEPDFAIASRPTKPSILFQSA